MSIISRLIQTWASLVESEEKPESRKDIVCLYDGTWHDVAGNRIEISKEEERKIVRTISEIESANYEAVPSLIMMDDVRTISDVADYLECDREDMFLFFKYPTNDIREWKSPSSEDPTLSGGLYFLASANSYAGVDWVEVADISGSIDNASTFGKLLSVVLRWLKSRKIKLVASNCREATSNRFFTGGVFLRRFENEGYSRLGNVNRTEETDGEIFHLNILVDMAWWGSLSESERKEIVSMIERNL